MTYSDVSLMIDGAWTQGAAGRTIPIVNPATEEVIGQVAHAETSDLDRALELPGADLAEVRRQRDECLNGPLPAQVPAVAR